MADKVEYGKIVVQVDQIMQKLHQVAKENAKVEEDGYSIFNSLVDTDSPTEGMNPTIILRKAEPIDVKEKHEFFKKIQDYVKYFAGENYAQKITEDKLVPIFTNNNLNGEESSSETSPEPPSTTSESIGNQRLFLNHNEKMAFIAVESMFNDKPGVVILKEADPPPGDSETPDEPKPEDKVYGYSVGFLFYKGGQSVNYIGLGSKGKRMLSGVWADLANIKIKTLGGGEIPIGGMIAKATRFFTRTKININDADNFIKKIIYNDYPQSSAIVRGYDVNSLKAYLMKSDQWNPDYENLFKNCEYAITIEVERKDKAYEQYSKETIANICTRAFGDALKIAKNPFTANKVKPDQVIKIENYRSEFRDQSIYNRRASGKDSASSTSESVSSFERYTKNGHVHQILKNLFCEATEPEAPLISVDFMVKDPTKENSISHSIGIGWAKQKEFKNSGPKDDKDIIPTPPEYEGFRFRFWNPDPNEFTTNPSKNEDGKIEYYPNVSNAEYGKEEIHGDGNDFYIVPHKCLVSKNRKDDYEVANDGTVTAKRSKEDYKRSDFTR